MNPSVIKIDDVEYVRKDYSAAPTEDGLEYVVVRCYSAGVHVGYLKSQNERVVRLLRARRCWKFVGVGGTGSCTELALHGPDAEHSRICAELPYIDLLDAIEVLPVSAAAHARLKECTP